MAQPTKPGNAERGWNDPPMFLSTPGVGTPPVTITPGKRSSLNKRVAHPGLYGEQSSVQPQSGVAVSKASGFVLTAPPIGPPTGPPPAVPFAHIPPTRQTIPAAEEPLLPASTTCQSNIVIMPPAQSTNVPKFTAPIIVPTMSPTDKDFPLGSPTNPITNQPVSRDETIGNDDISIPNFDDDKQLFHYVVTRLQRTLLDCKAVLEQRDAEDCEKRLGILSDMWEKGLLSYPVKSALAKLATALHRRKCDLADSIHLALMFDHVSEVSQWMVGVKRLIREARSIAPPVCPTDKTSEELAHANQTKINSEFGNGSKQEIFSDNVIDKVPTTEPTISVPAMFPTDVPGLPIPQETQSSSEGQNLESRANLIDLSDKNDQATGDNNICDNKDTVG